MSKVTHLIALTTEELEITYSALITTRECCMAGLIECQSRGDIQGVRNAQEVLQFIKQTTEKFESRIAQESRRLAESEIERIKSEMYDPRREI